MAETSFDVGRELWPFGTHLAVVRVDREAGNVNIVRIVAVDDCGTLVNPMIVEGRSGRDRSGRGPGDARARRIRRGRSDADGVARRLRRPAR
jgi:hypothetical protein